MYHFIENDAYDRLVATLCGIDGDDDEQDHANRVRLALAEADILSGRARDDLARAGEI